MQETFPAPLPLRWALVLSILSAVLLTLAFPYARLYPLTLFALVPFILALHGQGWRRGLSVGLAHAFVFQSYLMFWSNFFGAPAFLFLALYRCLIPTLFGGAVGWLSQRRPQLLPAAFVTGWISVEYLQTFGPFGVTWGMLSHAWAREPMPLQVNSLLGPWCLSAVLLLTNMGLFLLWQHAWRQQRRAWWGLGVAAWVFVVGFGEWRLAQPWKATEIEVGAVQVSMGRDVKWNPNFALYALERLKRMTREAAAKGARLVVWPETAIPIRGFLRNPNLTLDIALTVREAGCWVVAGSIEMALDAQKHTLNTASLISPEGEYVNRYDKQRLVPGGEYLPLESWLRPFSIFDRVMRYMPGSGNGIFPCGDTGVTGGMLICFESMVPYLAAKRVEDGANLLIVATNDGWFGDNSAIQHHFEMAIMRAVEQGKPVLQCGNTGVSGIVDSRGRVQTESVINRPEVLVAPIEITEGTTLYHRLGDVLAYLALGLFSISLLGAKGSAGRAGKS